jgi:hypothetical protein
MSRVLVCGGRSYADFTSVSRALLEVHLSLGILLLVHGGVSGADALAGTWAVKFGVPSKSYPPDHDRHGDQAIFIRNGLMIADGRPHLVIAFPGGPGTMDLLAKAAVAGLPIWHPADESLENVVGNGANRIPSDLAPFRSATSPKPFPPTDKPASNVPIGESYEWGPPRDRRRPAREILVHAVPIKRT